MSSVKNVSKDLLDVRAAAALVDRHPETIRRWVWSGRLAASKRGNRLLVDRDELRAAAGEGRESPKLTWAEWAERAREHRREIAECDELIGRGSRQSASDLIRQGREERADQLMRVVDERARR